MFAHAHSRLALVSVVALVIGLTPAFGQKKKKETPPPTPAVQAETRPSQKMAWTIRDILVSLQGQQTNLGILTKVSGDVVVFESEGDTLMYPLATVQVVKFLKVEEGDPRKVEVRFLSKD